MSEKRVKFYQITNNVTDDVYVGTTPQALEKRLYIHKTDTTKGSPSRLRALMQKIGKDKFKIELLEEGVFANADAINARELFWIREKGSTLNEGYTKVTLEAKEEQPLALREYMLHIQELQHKVQMLEAQLKTVQKQTQIDMNTTTSTISSSLTCPKSFSFSDDDMEVDLPPDDLPNYDLSDDMFKVLKGKIDQEDIDDLRQRYTKTVRLGIHIQAHPKDEDNKEEFIIYKEELAKISPRLRLDADKIGFDQPCLRLLDTIEKQAKIGNNMKKKAKQRATDRRKRLSYEDEYDDEVNDDDIEEVTGNYDHTDDGH